MLNSEAQKNHLLATFIAANKNKNYYIKAESIAKKEFLDFVGEDLSTSTIEVDGLTKTYTHGLIEKVDEVIDPKALYTYMQTVGLEDEFWNLVKPLKGELANYLSKRELAKLTSTNITSKLDLKETK